MRFPNQDITLINQIGYFNVLSELDIKRINAMYCEA